MTPEVVRSKFEKSSIEEILPAIEDKLSVIEKRFSAIEEILYSITKKVKRIYNSVDIHLNVDDAALRLGVSKAKMMDLFNGKEITHTIMNGNYYVQISDIDFWIMTGDTKLCNWDAEDEIEQHDLHSLRMDNGVSKYHYES